MRALIQWRKIKGESRGKKKAETSRARNKRNNDIYTKINGNKRNTADGKMLLDKNQD